MLSQDSCEIVPGVTRFVDLLGWRIECLSGAECGVVPHSDVVPASIGFLCTAAKQANAEFRCRTEECDNRVRHTCCGRVRIVA